MTQRERPEPIQETIERMVEDRCQQLETIVVLGCIALGALLVLFFYKSGWFA